MYHFQILHAQSKFPISGRLLFYQYSYRQEGVYWVLKHALGEVLHRLVFWFNPREPHLQHGTWNPKISRNHPEWVVGPGFALQPEAIAWLLPSAQWKSPKQKFIYLLIHSFNLCFVPQNYCKVVPNRFNRMNFFFLTIPMQTIFTGAEWIYVPKKNIFQPLAVLPKLLGFKVK